jgi:hypothetical protein
MRKVSYEFYTFNLGSYKIDVELYGPEVEEDERDDLKYINIELLTYYIVKDDRAMKYGIMPPAYAEWDIVIEITVNKEKYYIEYSEDFFEKKDEEGNDSVEFKLSDGIEGRISVIRADGSYEWYIQVYNEEDFIKHINNIYYSNDYYFEFIDPQSEERTLKFVDPNYKYKS